jgi:hypothetical protein
MPYSDVATVGFVFRNGQKVSNGDAGRIPVLVGQTVNAVKAGADSGKAIAKPAQAVIDVCNEVAKTDKLFNGLSKVVKFASDNVNPLIVASSGLKVALAKKEDKKRTFITEAGCVAGMFLGEGWMKKNLVGVLDKMNVSGKWKPIVKGLAFITGSITCSTIGQKLGEKISDAFETPVEKNARLKKQQMAEIKKSAKSIDYQA